MKRKYNQEKRKKVVRRRERVVVGNQHEKENITKRKGRKLLE